ncbi:MAG: hypothetical protein ABIH76_07315 [Candidatus Bathyarchaeota archaeon]
MANYEIDFMEYSTPALAQAAYVTNDVNEIPVNPSFETWTAGEGGPPDGWTASGDVGQTFIRESSIVERGTYSGRMGGTGPGYYYQDISAAKGLAYWKGKNCTLGCWVWCDTASRARIGIYDAVGVTNSSFHSGNSTWEFLTVTRTIDANATSLWCTLRLDTAVATTYFDNAQAHEGTSAFFLQSYSEATIKTQGSYALKAVAAITDSLNKTLTKTFATNQDLTGVKNLKFDMRSSRTGANIKLGLHDTGGTTTELTPTIATADTFQTFSWDLSGVSDANKDAIDTFTLTQVNADSTTTWYLDNFGIAQGFQGFWIG